MLRPHPNEGLTIMGWLRTIVSVTWLTAATCAAEADVARLTLCCEGENDLFRVLTASGYECRRVDSGREAVGLAVEGGAVMILAACFMRAVLRPSGNLFRHLLAAGHDGPFYRFRHVWCAVGVAALLGVVSATAQDLSFGLKGGVPFSDALKVTARSRYCSAFSG